MSIVMATHFGNENGESRLTRVDPVFAGIIGIGCYFFIVTSLNSPTMFNAFRSKVIIQLSFTCVLLLYICVKLLDLSERTNNSAQTNSSLIIIADDSEANVDIFCAIINAVN